MKRITAATLVILSLIGFSCTKEIQPGEVVATTRVVPAFNAINATDGFLVDVIRGDHQEVVVEAPEGYQSWIYTSVVDGELRIVLDKSVKPSDLSRRRVFVVVPNIYSVTATGGAKVYGAGIWDSPRFFVDVDGGSFADVNVATNELNVWASGGSEVRISGEAQNLYADEVSGDSKVYGFRFLTANADLKLSGASYFELTCTNQLNVSASGGSTVKYIGYPFISKNLTGGSTIVNAN